MKMNEFLSELNAKRLKKIVRGESDSQSSNSNGITIETKPDKGGVS